MTVGLMAVGLMAIKLMGIVTVGVVTVGAKVPFCEVVVGAVLGDDAGVVAGVLDALVSNSKNDSCSVELSCDS